MGENKNKTLENKLISPKGQNVQNIPLHIQRFWNDLQMQYGNKNIALIDFVPTLPDENYWRWYVKYDPAVIINKDLKAAFFSTKSLETGWGIKLEINLQSFGLFIPKNELVRIEKDLLQSHIILQTHVLKYFPFPQYWQQIKREQIKIGMEKMPLIIIGIWHHWIFYIQVLRKIVKENYDNVESVRKTMQRNITLSDFGNRLPSEQLTLFLYWIVERIFCEEFDSVFLEKVLSKSPPLIQSFWGNHGKPILSFLKHAFKKDSLRNDSYVFENPKMQKDFYNNCLTDSEKIEIQELLDDDSEHFFMKNFPEEIKKRYKKENLSFTQRMKKVIGTASIFERIQTLTVNEEEVPHPNFAPLQKDWIEKSDQNWFDLNKEETKVLEDGIDNYIIDERRGLFDRIVEERWNIHLKKLADHITAPFLLWENEDGQWFPQVNFLHKDQSQLLGIRFQKRLKREQVEFARLEAILVELKNKSTLSQIRNFGNEVEIQEFKFSRVQEKWDKAYNAHLINVKNKEHYRKRRMQEFGILEDDEMSSHRQDIWLDEMLKIEEEVLPFSSFVKQAFKAVLPVNKKIEFDPYRHSIDGVEFDPETIQNPEKWLNGEVMKPFIIKIENDRVEQVNAFALDYSGSMNHEKMRNLFKLCYLLISGLEGYKTYDAFHFFGTYFVETANFTHDYTNRSLLFKILKNISVIKRGKVEYKGTGGTNISEGIFECHQRVNNFTKNLEVRNSNVKYLKSVFVLTDGEPTAGIINNDKLAEAIDLKRQDGDFAIKGIYLKPEGEESYFMENIFGKNQFVETSEFSDAIQQFIYIMTLTYKKQREEFRKEKKLRRRK